MFEFTLTVRLAGTTVEGTVIGVTGFATTQAEALRLILGSQARQNMEVITIAAR